MHPMNDLELKYHLKDIERRSRKWEAAATRQAPCALCARIWALWQAVVSRRIF